MNGDAHVNGVENFWSLVKRCIEGTDVSVDRDHLFRYLEEESFRYNKLDKNDEGRFIEVVGAVTGKRLTYKRLTGKA